MLWRRVHGLYCGGRGGRGCSSASPHALDTPHHTPNHHVSQRVCWYVQDGIAAKYTEGRVSHTSLRCRVQKYFTPLSPIATPGVRASKLHPTNMFCSACVGACWTILWAEVQRGYRSSNCGCTTSPCTPLPSLSTPGARTGKTSSQHFLSRFYHHVHGSCIDTYRAVMWLKYRERVQCTAFAAVVAGRNATTLLCIYPSVLSIARWACNGFTHHPSHRHRLWWLHWGCRTRRSWA